MTRDPRVDPRVGDRVRQPAPTRPAVGFVREVRRIHAAPAVLTILYYHEYFDRVAVCSLTAWRNWAKNAEVLRCASEVQREGAER